MRTILVPIMLALSLAVPAAADGCLWSTSEADVTLAGYYVDDATSCSGHELEHCQVRVCGFLLGGSTCYLESAGYFTWVYEESNGIPGLQRQDEVVDDTCGGQIPGDRILY